MQEKAKEKRKPLLIITIDEHSGEAGLVTRLESFMDMLWWKNKEKGGTIASGVLRDDIHPDRPSAKVEKITMEGK